MKHTFTKVLSMILAIVMCLSTFAVFAFAAECKHENSKYYGYQEPTCSVPGGDMYRCEDCGEIYAKNVVAPKDHTPGPAATCTEDQKCTECKAVIKVKLGHTPVLGKDKKPVLYTKEADCTIGQDKYTYYVCSRCNVEYDKKATAGTGDHVLVADEKNVVAPTCTATGSMPYYCTNKGCTYTENVVIKATGHHVVDVAKKNPTCTEKGMAAHKYCKDCDGYFKAALDSKGNLVATTKAALELAPQHTAGSFIQNKVAGDCATDKIDQYYCADCEKFYDVNGGKVHKYESKETKATCTTYGYIYNMCTICGDIDESATKRIDPLGHTFYDKDGKLIASKKGKTYAATCTEGAYTEYTCDRCGVVKVYDETKPALNHDLKKLADAVAATCTKPGATAKFECKTCKAIIGAEEIPQLKHAYADVTYKPTCIDEGYTINECTMCGLDAVGATKKNIVKADGKSHVMVYDEITTTPTCVKAGMKTTYCSRCDLVDSMTEIPALGHDWADKATYTFAGSCVEKAWQVFECENKCGETKTVTAADFNTTPEGHERAMKGEGVVIEVLREGTCQIKELVRYSCTACAHEYEKNTKFGGTNHTLVQNIKKDADCTTETNGYEADGWYCIECTASATTAAGKDVIVWSIEPTVIPFKHEDTTVRKAVAATCDKDGYKAFNSCAVCDEKAPNTGKHSFKVLSTTTYKVAKLNHKGTDKVVKAKAATCTTDGNIAYRYCSVCKYYFKEALKDSKKSALLDSNLQVISNKKADVTLKMLGHKYVETEKVFTTCDQLAYIHHECSVCHDKYIDSFVNTELHVWNKVATVAPTCDTDGYTSYECENCTATAKNVKAGDHVAKLGHINKKGEIFHGLCNETVTDRQCVRDLDGDKKADCNVKFDEKNEIHDFKYTKKVAATCTEYGYNMILCANCEAKQITEYYPATGHAKDGTQIKDTYVAPTYTKEGGYDYKCTHVDANTGKTCNTVCHKTIAIKTGLNITIDADNAVANGYNLVNGGLVQFTVALETIDMKANSLLTTFKYDGMILEFVDAKVENIFGEGTINDANANVVNVLDPADNKTVIAKNGTLILSSYAPNTAEGKVQDVLVTKTVTYAVLTFRINKDAAGKDAKLAATDLELLNIKGEEPVKPVTDTAPVVETATISKLGETNADAAINSVDTLAIRKMITGELVINKKTVTYMAEADVDMDGDVDLEDFARLNKYLIGAITYDQLVLNK